MKETEAKRNKFALNGLLTQLANALVNSSCPLEGAEVMQFVSSKLDWVNTLENTPLTATVYSKKTRPNDDDVESDDEEHSGGKESGSDSDDDEEADPAPALLSPARVLGKSRLGILAVSNPKPVGDYSSPPRPRKDDTTGEEEEEEEKQPDAASAAAASSSSVSAAPLDASSQPEPVDFNEHSFWRLPIQEF